MRIIVLCAAVFALTACERKVEIEKVSTNQILTEYGKKHVEVKGRKVPCYTNTEVEAALTLLKKPDFRAELDANRTEVQYMRSDSCLQIEMAGSVVEVDYLDSFDQSKSFKHLSDRVREEAQTGGVDYYSLMAALADLRFKS